MRANGLDPTPGLRSLLSATFPTWPKEDGKVGKTRVGAAMLPGVLCVWEGGLELRSSAKLEPVPGAVVGKGLAGLSLMRFAKQCLDLPRPLLFIIVGGSYAKALSDARLTIDPQMVECFGSETFVLDARRVAVIVSESVRFKRDVPKLRAMRASLEAGVSSCGARSETILGRVKVRHPSHEGVLKEVVRQVGADPMRRDGAVPDATYAAVSDYWHDVALLPPSADPAWDVARIETMPEREGA